LESVLRYFEVWLLKLEGFLPDLRTCANCHKALTGDTAVYLGTDQSIRCPECATGRAGAISKRLHTQLRTAEKLSPAKFAEETREVPKETKREMAELTFQLIGRVLERTPGVRPAS
ncbi:MAG TPA: DNA repair protein RecO C-terminal domain-containing protein, partial [Pyrinomonadaceae bacterium]|nr:DNA repair protein RecO C-terminal domain-containing protein [Pyrinomonadaceae bacterium]